MSPGQSGVVGRHFGKVVSARPSIEMMTFRLGEPVRLLLVIVCLVNAVMPPGLCICAVVETNHQPVEVPQPPQSRLCCRHAHHATAETQHPSHDKPSRPTDDRSHHCQACEQLPATMPTAERWSWPDTPGDFVAESRLCSWVASDHVEVSPADPPEPHPRLRLHILCSLRM